MFISTYREELGELLQVPNALLGLGALSVLVAPYWWVAELLTHFSPQLLLLTALCAALILSLWSARRSRRWRVWAAINVASLTLYTSALWPSSAKVVDEVVDEVSPPVRGEVPRLSLLHLNLLSSNDHYSQVGDAIEVRAPDLVILQEFTPQWAVAMRKALRNYRPLIAQPRTDNFGMAVYARHDVEATAKAIDAAWTQRVPVLEVQLGTIRLLALHTLPPVSSAYAKRRSAQLEGAGIWAQEQRRVGLVPIVSGDLNCSPYSPLFRRLSVHAGIVDARETAGVYPWPTWPANPLRYGLGIAIDHVLVDPRLRASSFERLPDLGSDHYGIFARIR